MITADKHHTLALVGINQDCVDIMSSLLDQQGITVVRILDTRFESINELARFRDLDIIVDTSGDPEVASSLRRLRLPNVEILSGLSARILFGSVNNGEDDYLRRLLKNIGEVRAAVRLARNKEEILHLVLNLAIQATRGDSGSIMLIDKRKRTLKIEASYGIEEEIVKNASQKVGKGISGTVVKTKLPLLTQGIVDQSVYSSDCTRNDIISSICSPLLQGDEVIGVVNINSKTPKIIFTERDVSYVSRIAAFTTEIIKTSKEYEDSANSNFAVSLESGVRDILSLRFRFEERMNLLVMRIANAFAAETCNYYELDSETGTFMARATSNFNIDLMHGKQRKLSEYFARQVLESKTRFAYNAMDESAAVYKWYIAQPLIVNNEVLGILFIYLLSDRDNLDEECKGLEKISLLVASEMSTNREVYAARIQALRYSAISEASFDLASTSNLQDLSKKVLSNACLIFDGETSTLRFYSRASEMFERFDYFSTRNNYPIDEIEQLDMSISTVTATKENAMVYSDLRKTDFAPLAIINKTCMSASIRYKNNIIAVLSVYDRRSSNSKRFSSAFSDFDLEIFSSFIAQVSKALAKFIDDTGYIRILHVAPQKHQVATKYIRPESTRLSFAP